MVTFAVAFLVSLMSGLVLTLLVRNRAHAWGLLDKGATSRNIHETPVPRLGGVAIVLAFFAPLVALLVVDSGVAMVFREQKSLIVGLLAGGTMIALLGLYDDLKGARARVKLAIQIGVAVVLYFAGFRIDVLSLPFAESISLGYFGLPLTIFWIVGVINAVNLIDGLDGLAGGVALVAVTTNFVLAVVSGNIVLALMMAALGGAIVGFLFFNMNPATIFMGDTGSMFLGFVLAAVSLKTSAKSGTAVALLIPILSLGLPIMDTLLAMGRRALMGRPVFSSDKEHIHHRVMRLFGSDQQKSVGMLYALSGIFALTALAMHWSNSSQATLLLLGVAGVVVVVMKKLGFFGAGRVAELSASRKRNIELRAVQDVVTAEIRRATSVEQIWTSVRVLGNAVGASSTELTLSREEGRMRFENRRAGSANSGVTIAQPIRVASGVSGEIRLSWLDGRPEVDRDQEVAIERVAVAIAEASRRLSDGANASRDQSVRLRSA